MGLGNSVNYRCDSGSTVHIFKENSVYIYFEPDLWNSLSIFISLPVQKISLDIFCVFDFPKHMFQDILENGQQQSD
jgi:hypothetical protein